MENKQKGKRFNNSNNPRHHQQHQNASSYGKYNSNGKTYGNHAKFQPQFKKHTPNWKQADEEVKLLTEKYDSLNANQIEAFKDLPLSKRTLDGLKYAGYTKPTEIQRQSICAAFNNVDVLGAAKTGSGKTLAFLIPVLECLYRCKWAKLDGLGALIISPTRELAYQTFEVLKKIGHRHDFSAGLVIGGKDLKTESELITRTNIIVCTPGRLLQHMDETYNFSCDNLKVLVLDEADRILDLGFSKTINAIIENIPKQGRQTLLFSATQTKSITDLARLSLTNPAFISVHENSDKCTPDNLDQSYYVCEAHEKLSFLFSFLRMHPNSKVICFFQSCKQVKYAYEAFTQLGVGTNVLALYGTMNQLRRMEVYDQFCRKMHSILLSTDLASRGLDFPNINWVIQIDCPIDVNTYIHRVGRTARYEKNGQALLVLTQNESDVFIEQLEQKKIQIENLKVNKKYLSSIDAKLQALCAKNIELKESAKRAIMAYIKSLFLIKNKKLFDLTKIDMDKLAASYGLSISPRLRFLKRDVGSGGQQKPKLEADSQTNTEDDDDDDANEDGSGNGGEGDDSDEAGDEDNLFKVKRVYNPNEDASEGTAEEDENDPFMRSIKRQKTMSKAALAKRLSKRNIQINTKIRFNEDGADEDADEAGAQVSGINIEERREFLRKQDEVDKELFRQRVKSKHTDRRLKEKQKRREKRGQVVGANEDDEDENEEEGVGGARLGRSNEDNDGEDNFDSEDYDGQNDEGGEASGSDDDDTE